MNRQSRKFRPATILTALASALALILVATAGYLGVAQAAPQQKMAAAAKVMHTGDLQRSTRLDHYQLPGQSGLSGGARGMVRVASGDAAEGIGVQLVATNGVRTTVYTNEEGRYEFPKMQAGAYTFRIPTPRELKPYRVDSVQIDGATKLDDIVLERVSGSDG